MAESPPIASEAGARRPQGRGAVTRARVLEAARTLFIQQGYEGTSVGQIAEHAGVGVGTLYHHFPDKRALLLELVDAWRDGVVRDRSEGPGRALRAVERQGARAVVESWVRGTYDRLRKEPSLWVVVADLAGRDPEVAARWDEARASGAAWLSRFLEGLQAQGRARPDLDTLAAAWLVRDAVERAGLRYLVNGSADPPADRTIRELVEMVCRYLLVEPAS